MRSNSLKDRLIKLQLTLTIIVLTIAWIFVTINDFYIFRDLSIQNFETTVKILSRNLSTCLAFQDKDECQRVLSTLSKEENIIKALVIDSDGKQISSFHRKNSVPVKHEFDFVPDKFQYQIENDMIRTTYPIYEADSLEGRIFIVADFDLIETFGKRHALVFLFIMLGSVIIGVGLSTHLQRKITGQINLLLKTMQRIRTEKNYNLRINNDPAWTQIEIAEFLQLSESFDGMIEQIEMRDKNLKQQNEDLEKLVEEKVNEIVRSAELASLGEMACGIAHEINNPLTIIKASTKVLNTVLEKDKFEKVFFQEYLAVISTTVDRIAVIITGLKNISRRADDEERVKCQFSAILDDVLGVAMSKFTSKGVEFRKAYTEYELQTIFMANRVQLSQVLVNLLNNAYDAVSEYENKWIEIGIDMATDPDWIFVKVTDSGNGIPVKVREKMFNPFYTTKDIGKGTGIGLSISKSIIEKNGGKFYYDESSPNTSFIIQLPWVD